MSSDPVSRAVPIAMTVGDIHVSPPSKRSPDQNQGDESSSSSQAKRQRVAETTILQLRDLNADQAIASEKTLFTSFDCSGVPQKFKYSESEITILEVIGPRDHSMVYRISAGGRKFALKIHKYENSDISLSGIPKLNIFFERERSAYNRLSRASELPPASIPKYYGYINFTKPP
ncbi:predicted protein [Sclerotinia sclerotiorum 1980 UF-70]|uniref:Protein kinase domain-containing protein n=2 Tax=Sclerotinia sclerotiorum (strain ATCC 18683 / 1980 / Ss-1) TaxID=665079 RepID=A7EC78_SCLS1|nr:predicted protein [Sclerotinia sclerotiorum 1980 UF-70]APA09043.1 hypothetical protein sscle_04g038130 [Sclerotinia sclerotiorum 1980 UF-70]EDO00057.1 predicted protein [Sclerotinia sclerotiorum 1980 UF-70]